jgi:hypothetical protein
MKFLPLYDLQKEINRLFIAGSKFAKNDPRLQKQAAVFAKLGEKSPVFKKVAEGIENLINAEPADSSSKLLEVSTLLYSILYTQGETVDNGQPITELNPILPLKDVHTNKSYLSLKFLIEALSMKKEGRMGTVIMAFENKQCNDFRIYHLLDAVLADRYTDFADYVETTVIPAIGAPMIPYILKGFSYEGKTDDVRRLRILSKLSYSGIFEMADEILTGKSSVELQAAAVRILGAESVKTLSGKLELLIKFVGDKQKTVRLAAYETLAQLNTETTQNILVELFIKGNRKSDAADLSEILKMNLLDKFIPVLLEKAKASFRNCLALDKTSDWKIVIDAFENLKINMNPLINNANEDVITFYKEIFTDKKYRELSRTAELRANYSYPHKQIMASVAKNLENAKEGLECLIFLTEKSYCDDFLYSCFRTMVKHKTDKKTVYEYFSKYIDKLLYSQILVEVFLDENGNPNPNDMDERWKQLFAEKFSKKQNISFKLAKVYIGLLDEKSKELQSFLSHVISSYPVINDSFDKFAELLVSSGHPEAFEILFKAISFLISKGRNIPCDSLLSTFPKEYSAKFYEVGDKIEATNSSGANRHHYIGHLIK